jgi:HD-GYP domain-containing protein (c-di-GMP phosphodiesterase class II)
MVTLPMKNAKGEILGVLQLINCKREWGARLRTPADVEREVRPFSKSDVRQALSLASQAAVAYENSKLYEDIETLFEGFVKAAVTAIEQRDPTTSGHSFRVSTLTTGLAEVVDRASVGSYASARFTREQMKEIRYAALLHDFGKVGVREEVLVKAKKLYPMQLNLVQQRFDYIKKELEARVSQNKLRSLLEKNREVALSEIGLIEEEHKRQLEELDDYLQFVLQVNEPTVMPEGKFDRLIEIARQNFVDPRGIERPYLTPDEVRLLSIPKGSLDPDERTQIESHVVHTFNFLSQIPWTKEIKNIPGIARAHHEKLNGSGYPYKMKSEQIPLQAKMMTISDIFDALSATDRPYKRAVPVDRALQILEYSVKDAELDAELFKLFVEAKIYQLTVKGRG